MYKSLFCLASLTFSATIFAQPYLVFEPGAESVRYTPVVVVSKKLRTTLADAQAEFPGEEYFVSADSGAALSHAPAVFNGAWTYDINYRNQAGFSRPPKVDGLKTTGIANFVVNGLTVSPTYPVNVSFTGPTREFGAYLGSSNTDGAIYAHKVTVKADDVELGTVDLVPGQLTFVGVRDDQAPLGRITYTPIQLPNLDYIGVFASDSFYIEPIQ